MVCRVGIQKNNLEALVSLLVESFGQFVNGTKDLGVTGFELYTFTHAHAHVQLIISL